MYLVLCLSRFPLPAPRVPHSVWRAVPSGCPLPSLAGTPFNAVYVFRELGPVALMVVPACPLRVCALALPWRPLPPPLGGVACAPRAVPALGAGRAVPRGLCPSACPAPVPCSVWRAWGGAVRSRFPPTWLGVVGVAEGRPRGGCLPLSRGAYRPEPPEPAASAAHTRTGHCTRQGSNGALRQAPTPRLGSLRASPRGAHWRQASSTGPAAPAPRSTTH